MKVFNLISKIKAPVFSLEDQQKRQNEFTPEYRNARKIRSSKHWNLIRNLTLRLTQGMCIYCYKAVADEVHHIKGVAEYPELAFELDNLAPLCEKCHKRIEVRNKRGEDTEKQIRERLFKWLGIYTVAELAD